MTAELEKVGICPLGAKCREIVDGKIHECMWLVKLAGKDPQSEKEIDEEGCAMQWLPILLVENAQTNRGQTAAIESFRNEVVQQNEDLVHALAMQSRNVKLISND